MNSVSGASPFLRENFHGKVLMSNNIVGFSNDQSSSRSYLGSCLSMNHTISQQNTINFKGLRSSVPGTGDKEQILTVPMEFGVN